MKRGMLIAGVLAFLCVPSCYAAEESVPCEVSIIEQHDYSCQLIEKIKLQRNTIYNALNLSPKQVKAKDEIEKKRYLELEPELKNLCIYSKQFKDAKVMDDNAKVCDLEKKLKTTRENIQKISAKYDKDFEKILNSDQRAKYRMIRKLKRNDLKKVQKTQNNSSKPSDVKPFGSKMTQAEYTEQLKQKKSLFKKSKKTECKK